MTRASGWWGFLFACGLVGCSPYPYEKQAGVLDQAASGLRSSYSAGRTQLVAERNLADAAEWTASRPLLVTTDCSVDPRATKPCAIVNASTAGALVPPPPLVLAVPPSATSPAGTNQPRPEPDVCDTVNAPAPELVSQPPEALKPKVDAAPPLTRERAFKAIEEYTHGLAAITRSQDRKDYDAAVGEVAAGVAALGTAAGAFTGLPVGALIGPVAGAATKAVFWLIGTGIDHRRYETLSDSVVRACRPVRTLATVVGIILEEQQGERMRQLSAQITGKLLTVNQHRDPRTTTNQAYATMLEELLKVAVQYNTLRDSNPRELGASLAEAHDKLVLAVWRREDQSGAAIQALNDLADHVKAIRDAASGSATATAK
jgi:hypothetical protein